MRDLALSPHDQMRAGIDPVSHGRTGNELRVWRRLIRNRQCLNARRGFRQHFGGRDSLIDVVEKEIRRPSQQRVVRPEEARQETSFVNVNTGVTLNGSEKRLQHNAIAYEEALVRSALLDPNFIRRDKIRFAPLFGAAARSFIAGFGDGQDVGG